MNIECFVKFADNIIVDYKIGTNNSDNSVNFDYRGYDKIEYEKFVRYLKEYKTIDELLPEKIIGTTFNVAELNSL